MGLDIDLEVKNLIGNADQVELAKASKRLADLFRTFDQREPIVLLLSALSSSISDKEEAPRLFKGTRNVVVNLIVNKIESIDGEQPFTLHGDIGTCLKEHDYSIWKIMDTYK